MSDPVSEGLLAQISKRGDIFWRGERLAPRLVDLRYCLIQVPSSTIRHHS